MVYHRRNMRKKKNLKDSLDKVFSEYIRLKNANDMGFCRCVTCGKWYHWRKIQNGHYMSRRFMATRYSEMNCHPQCMPCNVMQHGNIPQYRMWLVEHYGEEAVSRLEFAAMNKVVKISDFEYREMLDFYTKLVKALKNGKGN